MFLTSKLFNDVVSRPIFPIRYRHFITEAFYCKNTHCKIRMAPFSWDYLTEWACSCSHCSPLIHTIPFCSPVWIKMSHRSSIHQWVFWDIWCIMSEIASDPLDKLQTPHHNESEPFPTSLKSEPFPTRDPANNSHLKIRQQFDSLTIWY